MVSMFQFVSDEEGIVPVIERVLARWDEVVRPSKRCKAYKIALHFSTRVLRSVQLLKPSVMLLRLDLIVFSLSQLL